MAALADRWAHMWPLLRISANRPSLSVIRLKTGVPLVFEWQGRGKVVELTGAFWKWENRRPLLLDECWAISQTPVPMA